MQTVFKHRRPTMALWDVETLPVAVHTWLENRLGVNLSVTTDRDAWAAADFPVYTSGATGDAAPPLALLPEGVVELAHSATTAQPHTRSPLPNLVALTREAFSSLQQITGDHHQLSWRYYASNQLPWLQGSVPVLSQAIAQWQQAMQQAVQVRGLDWQPPREPFQRHLTIDIDNLTAYYGKPWPRRLASLGRSMWQRDWPRVSANLTTFSRDADPYFSFAKIWALKDAQQDLAVTLFLHLGEYGAYDKPLPFESTTTRQLWQYVIEGCRARGIALGLHPSYAVDIRPGQEALAATQLAKECERFRQLTGNYPTHSRMHYLRWNPTTTPRLLLAAGITHDYTLAHPDAFGWVAGTHWPLPCPGAEELTLHPAPWMDTQAFGKNIAEGTETLRAVVDAVRTMGGPLCIITHNESFSEWGPFTGRVAGLAPFLSP